MKIRLCRIPFRRSVVPFSARGDAYIRSDQACGGCWAARREVFKRIGGPYAHNIVGGGDHHFVQAQTGELSTCLHNRLTIQQNAHFWRWAVPEHEMRAKRAGYVVGDAIHHDHGEREGLQYQARHEILVRHAFDPDADVCVNEVGLLEWCSGKLGLHHDVADYFSGRREDD